MKPKSVTHWSLQNADPKERRNEEHGYSSVESDWCVLELIQPENDGKLW